MTDPFDTFLTEALAPPSRHGDGRFVASVQARIAFEERLRATRRAELRELGLQALALFAVAAGLILLLRSDAIAELAGIAPGLTLLALLCAFALLVALVSGHGGRITKLNAG
jgi:hypothetical protein